MDYLESALNSNWITVALSLVVCAIIYVAIRWAQALPGPKGLPYLGYYPFLRKDCHLQFQNMTKKYGDVFCFECFGETYVYLGSIRAIKEAHVTKSDCFAMRPGTEFSVFTDMFGAGIVNQNGEKWKELRKFFVQRIKEFALAKEAQEGVMKDSLEKTVNAIRQADGEDFNFLTFLMDICGQMIYPMVLRGYSMSDDDMRNFNEAYVTAGEVLFGKNIFLSGPLLKFMMHISPEFKKYRRNKLIADAILAKIVEEHEKTFDEENIRNVIDYYIGIRRQLEEKRDPKSRFYTAKSLCGTLLQFLGDGGCFVGFMISLVLNRLTDRPDIQKEIQREIDDVVGSSRFPSWDDRSNMPYTSAFIQECFRSTDIFPVFTSLQCTKETTVGSCRVPKGAITVVGIWAASRDPLAYEQPEKFDPTRYMPTEDQKPKCPQPPFFGFGKRACIGEPLVVMEIFLFLCAILQNFDLHPAKESESGPSDSQSDQKATQDSKMMFRATPRKS